MKSILEGVKDKSFLSFTFDGKAIEDFGFAVIYEGDRLSLDLQPDFLNNTSTVPGRSGTLYWGTEITGKKISKTIGTDRATSRQINNLKKHFRAGKMGKFSLAESEYCYGYALVESVSTFSFVPFDEIVEVNGVTYSDTVYKGEMKIDFFFPDPYFYADIRFDTYGDKYIKEPWFLSSGLPLTSSISEKDCYLSNNKIHNEQVGNKQICYAYNAGNASAKTNVCFKKTFNYSGDQILWNDIMINQVIISKPRMIKDIQYTINKLNYNSSTWDKNKIPVIIDLRDQLDSCLRNELIGIVDSTGTGLHWSTPREAINEIKNILLNKKVSFSINGIEVQCVLEANLLLHHFGQTITTSETRVVENIQDATNNEYIEIEGSDGLLPDGSVQPQKITFSEPVEELKVYFLNTYYA